MYQPLILAIWSSDKVTTDNGGGWTFNDNLPSLVLGRSADGHSLPAHAH